MTAPEPTVGHTFVPTLGQPGCGYWIDGRHDRRCGLADSQHPASDTPRIGTRTPCPATMVGILGFDQPTTIPCGRLEGHEGPHMKHFEWTGVSDV